MTSRIRYLPRSNTLPDVEELEAVSKHVEKQISRLQEDDEVSTTVSSVISDGSPSKRSNIIITTS